MKPFYFIIQQPSRGRTTAWRRHLKDLIRTYAPAVLSGVLLVFSFPPFDLYPLAWVSLVPLLVTLWDRKPKEAFLSGVITGVVSFYGTLYWIYHSITHYGSVPLPVSLAVVLLLCLYLSLYPGIFSLLFSLKIRSTRLPALLLAPVFWVSLEFARSYALTGFPWSSIGYSQYLFLPAIQFADATGIYGVSFLVVAVNGAIADFPLMKKRTSAMPLFPVRQTFLAHILLSVLIVSALAYGYWRLHQDRHGQDIRVSVIQGNIDQGVKWDPAYQDTVVATYTTLTRDALSSSPHLIVWPETALPFYFNASPLTEPFLAFQRDLNTYLLFGSVLVKSPPSGDRAALLTNSVVLLDPSGTVSSVYDKIHLVPFGEYVPAKGLFFFLGKVVEGIGDYAPGERVVKADTVFGSFGTFICYEIIFPGLVRKFYARDGDFIVTITNDAWFGRTSGPYQHFSMAVFRAIENRKPVVRAANTGISGFIDSSGRILAKTGLFERNVLTMKVRTDSTRTLYSLYGDIFSYLVILAALLVIVFL